MFQRKTDTDDAELAQLESLLQSALLPKVPRPTYGQDLQRRLSNQSAPTLEFPAPDYSLLWFVLATILAMLLILLGVKAFITLGGLTAISKWKRDRGT
jgi:hypothetical protein